MASTRELRRRIRSVKNTAQITKAMEMVAATKMKKAQNQALGGRPYLLALNQSLKTLVDKINPDEHKLLQSNNSTKTLVLVITTDKGLVGALNTNIIRSLVAFIKDRSQLDFVTIGKKGQNFIVRSGLHIEADFANPNQIDIHLARQIQKIVMDKFLAGDVKEVFLIYPDFVSALKQEANIIKLLPVDLEKVAQAEKIAHVAQRQSTSEFLFEPNIDELLDFILVHSVETKIYHALLETKASEYSAQMVAMQNATDNAQELVEDLNLTYNQIRQDSITSELSEITSASLALE